MCGFVCYIYLEFIIGLGIKFYFINLVVKWEECNIDFVRVLEFGGRWLEYVFVVLDYCFILYIFGSVVICVEK